MASAQAPTGAVRRRRLAAQPRQESIVAAATTVFAEHGYRRARMTDVAALVGVTEAVVFHNFGTKAKLFTVVLDRAVDEVCAVFAAAAVQADRPLGDFLAEFLSPEHLDRLHQRGAPGVIFADATSLADDPLISAHSRQALARLAAALADMLAAGQRAGSIRADLDPGIGAAWILSMLHARRFLTSLSGSRQLEQGIVDLTLQTLTGRDAARIPRRP